MSERRTIYESAAGRRRRRLRAARVAALVAVLALAAVAVAAAFALRDGSGAAAGGAAASAAPSSAPSPAPARLARLADVEVHQGDTATIRYRVVAAAGTTAVTLVVRDAGGQQVKARRLTDAAEPGERLEAVVPIDLPPGRYTYELRLGDEDAASPSPSAGAAQASGGSASAALVVRKPLPPGFPGKKRRRGGHGVDLGPRRRRRVRRRGHQRRGRRRPPAARALPAGQPLQGHPAGRLPARRPDAGRGDRGDAHER